MELHMQALQHPWLKGGPEERSIGKALSLKVVQRIQVCQALYNPMACTSRTICVFQQLTLCMI